MPTSLIHDASAQYLATLMFAITMLAAGGLRSLWRRSRQAGQQEADPPREEQPASTSLIRRVTQADMGRLRKSSFEGRQEESS